MTETALVRVCAVASVMRFGVPAALLEPDVDGLAGHLAEAEEGLELLQAEGNLSGLGAHRVLLKVARIDGQLRV
jgi:hypothetical protein